MEALQEQETIDIEEKVDMSDINELFGEKGRGPHLLEMEFEPVTDEPEAYVSARTGNETQCWRWRHLITGAVLKRFLSKSGKSWDTGKLSSYLRGLKENDNNRAYERAVYILKLNAKHFLIRNGVSVPHRVGSGAAKEELVRQWIRGVMFCIESNCATVSLQGRFAQRFFSSLDPSHIAPQRIPFMRIVRLLDMAVSREFQRIVNDNFLLYGSNFVSTNSDFFTNSERRESFGCVVANMLGQRYYFEVRSFEYL